MSLHNSIKPKPWVERAVLDIAKQKNKTLSWVVNFIVEISLNNTGVYRNDYEDVTCFVQT